MKYRIREVVAVMEGRSWFYPEKKTGWLVSWAPVGHVKFLTLAEAKLVIDEEVARRQKVETLFANKPPVIYHPYKK